jgi:tetratricopeptide (TPR) repeat protein
MKINLLSCPYCGGKISKEEDLCEYCGHEYFISSFSSDSNIKNTDLQKYIKAYDSMLNDGSENSDLNYSLGICYLRLRMYIKARSCFDKAIDMGTGDSEAYFFAAVSILNGKKPFINSKKDVDNAMEYLNAAIAIEDRPKYRLLMAYLKFDYYEKKHLRIEPSYKEDLAMALVGSTDKDRSELFALLKVDVPDWSLQ